MSGFQKRVLEIVQNIPKGKVVSYGQVAAYIGSPRAARQVGWALRAMGGQSPWWRVINNAGRISIKGNAICTPQLQRKLLREDGVHVSKKFEVDIEKYRFTPA